MLAGNIPQRDICEQLRMGRGVLDKYKKAAIASGATFSELGRMSDEEIGSFLMSTKKVIPQSERRQILESLIPDYVSDLAHNHFLTIVTSNFESTFFSKGKSTDFGKVKSTP